MKTTHIFEGFGIELEYMIVDRQTLNVRPIADKVLQQVAGTITNEVERGTLGWSNELVLHVIELKTLGPVPPVAGLYALFQEDVRTINAILAEYGARLLPTAMHPWMEPARDSVLWPHSNHEIYESYNRIFDCQGHGWTNLQSTHINLAFNGDAEFGRLHSAIRLLLPILPAIAASSPVAEGAFSNMRDTRLFHYRRNQRLIPAIAGMVIPEPVLSRQEYEERILQRIYRDIAPHDPGHILQYEWLNSRGAIARFDRNAIEIRLLDVQECPLADIAIAVLIIEVLKKIAAETWTKLSAQIQVDEGRLAEILTTTILNGEQAVLDDPLYLACFGLKEPVSAGRLWAFLADQVQPELANSPAAVQQALTAILTKGPLANRLTTALNPGFDRDKLTATYRQLSDCLHQGELFLG
jgi:gamma-glutamyl:cysteine ligase YbdK (ATP-grasp superfamily)